MANDTPSEIIHYILQLALESYSPATLTGVQDRFTLLWKCSLVNPVWRSQAQALLERHIILCSDNGIRKLVRGGKIGRSATYEVDLQGDELPVVFRRAGISGQLAQEAITACAEVRVIKLGGVTLLSAGALCGLGLTGASCSTL
jgi:hypothetical protein